MATKHRKSRAKSKQVCWLHLSDLHWCAPIDGWDSTRIREALLDDLSALRSEHDLRPEFVFFTGDLAFGNRGTSDGLTIHNQFREAHVAFLVPLCAHLDPVVPIDNVFIVPGNHDINRDHIVHGMHAWLEQFRNSSVGVPDNLIEAIRDCNADWRTLCERLGDYCQFLEDCGYDHLCQDADRLIFAHKRTTRSGAVLEIFGLNSAWSSGIDDERNRLWMAGAIQIEMLLQRLKKSPDALRIALVHHPWDWLVENEKNEVRDRIRERTHFLLHGHEHELRIDPFIGQHIQISTGACYAAPYKSSGYNIVSFDCETKKGQVWLRRFGPTGWMRQTENLSIPVELKPPPPRSIRQPRVSRDKARKTGKPDRKHAYRFNSAAMVLICDIVDFSNLAPSRQEAMMDQLWAALDKHPLTRRRKKHKDDRFVTMEGDGALVVFLNPVHPRDLFELADFLVQHMKTVARAGLRVGLHMGPAKIKELGGRQEPFGTAINECTRIKDVGDAGDIIASDLLAKNWRDSGDEVDPDWFIPSLNDIRPIEIHIKVRQPSLVRVYARQHDPQAPKRIADLTQISKRLLKVLGDIEVALRERLAEFESGFESPELLGARVSILERIVDLDRKFLKPTHFRYYYDENASFRNPGRTLYSADGKGAGVARAFCSRKPFLVINLPDPEIDDGKPYIARLTQPDVGLDEFTIATQWQRKSRSLLAFPFGWYTDGDSSASSGTSDNNRDPDGVVCIDCAGPLAHCPVDKVRAALADIQKTFSESVSLLWLLRMSV